MNDVEPTSKPSAEVRPDGFYAVCLVAKDGILGFLWTAWWQPDDERHVALPGPNAWGLADERADADLRARAVILEAMGDRATVLQLDSELAVQAVRWIPEAKDWFVGGNIGPKPIEPGASGYTWIPTGARWNDVGFRDVPEAFDPSWWRHAAPTPLQRPPVPPAMGALGLAWPFTAEDARRASRREIAHAKLHPDQGGAEAGFKEAAARMEEAVAYAEAWKGQE